MMFIASCTYGRSNQFSHIRIAFSHTYMLQMLSFFWLLRKYDAFVMNASFGGLRDDLELTKIQWSHPCAISKL
jgi:hypothetical protein